MSVRIHMFRLPYPDEDGMHLYKISEEGVLTIHTDHECPCQGSMVINNSGYRPPRGMVKYDEPVVTEYHEASALIDLVAEDMRRWNSSGPVYLFKESE